MTTIWEDIKNAIRGELSDKSFSLWINPLTMLEEQNDCLVLGCPNKFSLNWITENYKEIIEKKLTNLSHGQYSLALKISPSKKKKRLLQPLYESSQMTFVTMANSINGNGRKSLNHDFTFDRFVVGKCNEFAYSASKAMAGEGNWPYSHLYMLANTGLGKSHLSHAIGNAILEQDPKVRVCYITAEGFVNEMVHALKTSKIEEFKNKYRRSCDVLLLEEIHFLGGKEKIQLELGYTLDALANDHKRIIFTSALLPKNIPSMTKSLSSRLTSGIITTLDTPDYDTRVKIIEKKAAEQKVCLSEEIIHLLAKYLVKDIRQIESALRCLKAKTELLKEKIDHSLAKEVIKCHIPEQNSINLELIKDIVCQYFKIDPLLLQSKSRKRIHSYPRNIYVYLCRRYTDTTVEEIGKSIDRNHSTVLYSSEMIEHKMRTDSKVKNQIDFLERKLKSMTT